MGPEFSAFTARRVSEYMRGFGLGPIPSVSLEKSSATISNETTLGTSLSRLTELMSRLLWEELFISYLCLLLKQGVGGDYLLAGCDMLL